MGTVAGKTVAEMCIRDRGCTAQASKISEASQMIDAMAKSIEEKARVAQETADISKMCIRDRFCAAGFGLLFGLSGAFCFPHILVQYLPEGDFSDRKSVV